VSRTRKKGRSLRDKEDKGNCGVGFDLESNNVKKKRGSF